MKNLIFCIIFLLTTSVAHSQIHILRYNDNFTYLKNDTVHKKGFETIKYIRLVSNVTCSFGGEVREQFQYYGNQNFGDVPRAFSKVSTGQLWQRVMAHTNIELGGKIRMFAQLGSTFRFFNPNPLTPEVDENQLSLHQGFGDYYFDKKWTGRIGRQEISYGNNRVLTFREGPNTRLAFDAAIIKYYSGKRNFDFFTLTPVTSRQGIFDDKSFEDIIVGIYATEKVVPNKLLIDYYFINFISDRRSYNYIKGKENRHSYGFRIFSQNPKLNYELEATYQSGKFIEQQISAYSITADVNYRLVPEINFTAGLGGNYISGDKDNSDNQLNTYNLIFSKPQFGLTAPIGTPNVVNVNPYIKINPIKKMNVNAGAYFMSRQSSHDGIYSPLATEIRPTPKLLFASTQKEIGTQFVLESTYFARKNLLFAFDAAYFFAGKYVRETGKGKDITYLSFKCSYKF